MVVAEDCKDVERAIAASPPSDGSVKRRIEYVKRARKVADGLRGVNPKLKNKSMKLRGPQNDHSGQPYR